MTDELFLPTRLAPPADYYRMMALHPGAVRICSDERFDKRRKAAHRFAIADTRGRKEITVPVEKPYGRSWNGTRVSLHGDWWELAARTLESAYGRTPYFEFYADDFLPLLSDSGRFTTVAALNADFDRAIRRALGLQKEVSYVCAGVRPSEPEAWEPQPYWQVRAEKLGFIGGLSILDMLFNLGPETLPAITQPKKR